jgi:hypothetical protein
LLTDGLGVRIPPEEQNNLVTPLVPYGVIKMNQSTEPMMETLPRKEVKDSRHRPKCR